MGCRVLEEEMALDFEGAGFQIERSEENLLDRGQYISKDMTRSVVQRLRIAEFTLMAMLRSFAPMEEVVLKAQITDSGDPEQVPAVCQAVLG